MEQAATEKKGFAADLTAFDGSVVDVSDSTWDFLKRHPRYLFLIGAITVFIESVILMLGLDPQFMLLPLLIPAFAYYRVHKRMETLFFTQVASALGMTYEPSASRDTVSGHFFNTGSGGSPAHVLTGAYEGVPIRLYEYQFTTGSGKHKQTHPFMVSEIDTKGDLPHIFMKPDGFSVFGKPPGTKLLSLEGNFNDHFDVYVPEDSEIEALQILEPDVMARLIDEFSVFGFECSGTKTYVFTSGSFADNRESLLAHIKLLERLYDELVPELRPFARASVRH